LMERYAHLAIDAGARIVGGCCGTSPEHLAAMRKALDAHKPGPRPDRAMLERDIGPLIAPPVSASDRAARTRKSLRAGT